MNILIALISLSLFVSACSKNEIRVKKNDNNYLYPTAESRNAAFKDWTVSCEKLQECPEGVAQLVIKKRDNSILVCTAFLVENGKKMITNDHCVKDLEAGVSCEEEAIFVFPSTPRKALQRASCGKVIARTNKVQFNDPDLAVIELKNAVVDRKPFQLDDSGIKHQEALWIYKINPGEVYENRLEVEKCIARKEPMYLPGFIGDKDPTVALTDCKIVHGNSGSPLIAGNGKVKAVMYGTLGKDESDYGNVSEFENKRSLSDHPDLVGKHMNFATNATCLAKDKVGIDLDKCANAASIAKAKENKKRRDGQVLTLLEQIKARIAKWASANGQAVVFMGTSKSHGHDQIDFLTIQVGPKCIQPIENWGKPHESGRALWTSYEDTATLKFDAPKFIFQRRFDSNYRDIVSVKQTIQKIEVTLSPSEYANSDKGVISLARPSETGIGAGLMLAESAIRVPVCAGVQSPLAIITLNTSN